jgi:hypothetical protein
MRASFSVRSVQWGAAALVALAPFYQSAFGAAVNIQFGANYTNNNNNSTTYDGYSAAASTGSDGGGGGTHGINDNGTAWNNFQSYEGGTATVDSSGQSLSSDVTVSFTYQGNQNYAYSGYDVGAPVSATDPSDLLDYYNYQKTDSGDGNPNATPAGFSISGLAPGAYDVYLYSEDGTAGNADTVFTINGVVASQTATNLNNVSTFVQNQDYVVFDAVPTSGDISGIFSPTSTDGAAGVFNGITLVAVPEPASVGILTVGTLGLLARRRRASARSGNDPLCPR